MYFNFISYHVNSIENTTKSFKIGQITQLRKSLMSNIQSQRYKNQALVISYIKYG